MDNRWIIFNRDRQRKLLAILLLFSILFTISNINEISDDLLKNTPSYPRYEKGSLDRIVSLLPVSRGSCTSNNVETSILRNEIEEKCWKKDVTRFLIRPWNSKDSVRYFIEMMNFIQPAIHKKFFIINGRIHEQFWKLLGLFYKAQFQWWSRNWRWTGIPSSLFMYMVNTWAI